MEIYTKLQNQINWLARKISCLESNNCGCQNNGQQFILDTSNTTEPDGSNGASIISTGVKQISAYDKHLEFVDSPMSVSNIPGHTVLKLKDEIADNLGFQSMIDNLELNLSWKNGDRMLFKNQESNTVGITDNVYRRTGVITYTYPRFVSGSLVYDAPTLPVNEINNLVIDIPGFDKLKNYSPKIVLSRYKPSRNKAGSPSVKKATGPNTQLEYSKSGFKISHINDPLRPSKIALNAGHQVIDFGQEYYFTGTDWDRNTYSKIYPRGISRRHSHVYMYNGNTRRRAWMYFEVRIEINVNGTTYMSKPLNKFKMVYEQEISSENILLNSRIKFKFA